MSGYKALIYRVGIVDKYKDTTDGAGHRRYAILTYALIRLFS